MMKYITLLTVFSAIILSALLVATIESEARERGDRTRPPRHETPAPTPDPVPPYLDPIIVPAEVLERWKEMIEEGRLDEVEDEFEYFLEHGELPPEDNTGDQGDSGSDGTDGEDGQDGDPNPGSGDDDEEMDEEEEEETDPRIRPRTREINRDRGAGPSTDPVPEEDEVEGEEENTEEEEENDEGNDDAPLSYLEEVAAEINRLTNTERVNMGLVALETDSILADIAEGHSNFMAETGLFSHTQVFSDGTTCSLTCRLEEESYQASSWGENIAWRSSSSLPEANELALSFVRGWINSQGHRDNMLSSDFTHTGIGLAQIGNTIFATVDFAKK